MYLGIVSRSAYIYHHNIPWVLCETGLWKWDNTNVAFVSLVKARSPLRHTAHTHTYNMYTQRGSLGHWISPHWVTGSSYVHTWQKCPWRLSHVWEAPQKPCTWMAIESQESGFELKHKSNSYVCMAEDIKATHSIGQQDMLTLKTGFIAAKLKFSYKLFLYGISCTKRIYI